VFNLGCLAFFKYAYFLTGSVETLFGFIGIDLGWKLPAIVLRWASASTRFTR